jgi:hypothetical protein
MSILGADIANAYLNAPTTEKQWTILGAKRGTDAGKKAIIVSALYYGLKLSGAAYWNHLASYLQLLGFKSCLTDPDVLYRIAKLHEGEEFYEYLLVYTDNLLAVATGPQAILDNINLFFHHKSESGGHPNIYLGLKVSKAKLANRIKCWCNSSCQYVKEAIKNTEMYIQESNGRMP